jgi:tRNA U34 5-carboxymethylaminomethyl modifying enzyme MnmG/GidA
VPSNKDRVASYLEDDESQALSEFCKEKGMTSSQGVAYLIRTKLIEPETTEGEEIDNLNDERLKRLEETLANWQKSCFRAVRSNEKLQELVAKMEMELERVQAHIKQEQLNRYDDETIAAITGQPKEKVYLWRMGLAKPRGCRILEKLAPYEVKEGRWTRKE